MLRKTLGIANRLCSVSACSIIAISTASSTDNSPISVLRKSDKYATVPKAIPISRARERIYVPLEHDISNISVGLL